MLLTLDQIDSCLKETKYRNGFPGMNGRAWTRIGSIYDLVNMYSVTDRSKFVEWLQEKGKTSEEDAELCFSSLYMKYGKLM